MGGAHGRGTWEHRGSRTRGRQHREMSLDTMRHGSQVTEAEGRIPERSEARDICKPTHGALTPLSVGSHPKTLGSSIEVEERLSRTHHRGSQLWDQRSRGSEPDSQSTPPCLRMEASSHGPQRSLSKKRVNEGGDEG